MLSSGLYKGKCKTCRKDVTFWSVPSPVREISFNVNGIQHIVTNSDPAMSLNEWIRNQPGLQGKSYMESNITIGISHCTAFICFVLFFSKEESFI